MRIRAPRRVLGSRAAAFAHASSPGPALPACVPRPCRAQLQEQITRVLVERLIVHRPHPWGLLITFIELMKNPRYNFWAKPFIRAAPEIEKLFESVSRSCMGAPAALPAASGGDDGASCASSSFALGGEH